MQVQGLFSLAGASLASPPLVRALRLQISAIHCRALRDSPTLRWQCPALRFAAHRSPSHPNPHPLPLSPSHSPRGLTTSGRLAASCSRRLSPLRFARLLLQVAISPPFALIGGGPLFSRPPLRSPEFIGYRTEIMMILPPSGAACPRRTPGAARRMFRFGLSARPRRYRLRNVAACPVALILRHPAYPYCGFV